MSEFIQILNKIYQTKDQSSEQWIYLNNYLIKHPQEINNFIQFIINKLNNNNNEEQLLTLDILDYSMDNGRMELWIKVSSKEFLSFFLQLLKDVNDEIIQEKILYLIEKWGKNYDKDTFPNLNSFYISLKKNGIQFPINYNKTYSNYLNNNKSNDNINEYDNENLSDEYINEKICNLIKYSFETSLYEKKYRRLVIKLNEMAISMIEFNDMIKDDFNEKKIENSIKDMRHGFKQLKETIDGGRLKDKKLMDITLFIFNCLKKVFDKWEKIKNNNQNDNFNNNQNNFNFNNQNNSNQQNNKVNDLFDLLIENNNSQNQQSNLDIGNYPQIINNNNMNMNNNLQNNNNMINTFQNNMNMNNNIQNNNNMINNFQNNMNVNNNIQNNNMMNMNINNNLQNNNLNIMNKNIQYNNNINMGMNNNMNMMNNNFQNNNYGMNFNNKQDMNNNNMLNNNQNNAFNGNNNQQNILNFF